jgi:hypothetical protein
MNQAQLIEKLNEIHKEKGENSIEFKTTWNQMVFQSFMEGASFLLDGDFYENEFFIVTPKQKVDLSVILNTLDDIFGELAVVKIEENRDD